jgi:putative heme iron utilization protein
LSKEVIIRGVADDRLEGGSRETATDLNIERFNQLKSDIRHDNVQCTTLMERTVRNRSVANRRLFEQTMSKIMTRHDDIVKLEERFILFQAYEQVTQCDTIS